MESIRRESGKDIWLVGGGALVAASQKAQPIDDVILVIHPVILGSGIPLFIPGAPQMENRREFLL